MGSIVPLSPSWGSRASWKYPLGITEELPTAVLAAHPQNLCRDGFGGNNQVFLFGLQQC